MLQKYRELVKYIPEALLMLSIFIYWKDTFLLNPVAIAVSVLMLVHIFWQNFVFGFIVSGIFAFLGIWMCLAFLSDAIRITDLNAKAIRFLIYGIIFLGPLLLGSSLMVLKYIFKLTPGREETNSHNNSPNK